MTQKDIEIILLRQLAGYLVIPVFVVDPVGTLVFYNEPAESILGHRFEETGEMPVTEWSTVFVPLDETGTPLPAGALPLVIALNERRPVFLGFSIRGLDGITRQIEASAFPLIGMADRLLGAAALFWEKPT